MQLQYRNVNEAFTGLVRLFHLGHDTIVRTQSRNGPVMMINEPTLITYTNPRERVLFNGARDANPFLHVYEALWMLAGRNVVAPLAWYAKQFTEYSDDGMKLNDAYGYRWRNGPYLGKGVDYPRGKADQLVQLVAHLKSNPTSRRAVLTMWNVEDDLLKVDDSKAVCCNLNVMFALREAIVPRLSGDLRRDVPVYGKYLDMTVTNRSNDLIWGLLGTNYVAFSFLQEYMATRLGVEVGLYHHFSNNLHCYENTWKPKEWLEDRQQDWYGKGAIREHGLIYHTFPLVRNPVVFDQEVRLFAEYAWGPMARMENAGVAERLSEPFLVDVALPLYLAYSAHKDKDYYTALSHLENCVADDWRIAAQNWINRRMERKHHAGK